MRSVVALCTSVCMLVFALPAFANAPNPGTTTVDQVTINPDGSRTVTVQGTWTWASQTNCPTARNGVGYQVDWFDNQINSIGTTSSPNGILYVGDALDNIVHSVEQLGGDNTIGNAFYNGVPSTYGPLAGTTTNTSPTATDAKNWFSECDGLNASGVTAGSWGPISHTYASTFTQQIQLCPIMYDPHGGHDNSGQSSVQDITAGSNSSDSGKYNSDNSYQTNGTGPNGNICPKITIPTLTTSASPASGTIGQSGGFHDSATLQGSSGSGTITWNVYLAGSGCTGTPKFTDSKTVSADGTYTNPNAFNPTTIGTYQWQAEYSSSTIKDLLTNCSDSGEQTTVNPATPTLKTTATDATVPGNIQDTATLSGGDNPQGTITWTLYGPNDSNCSKTPAATFTNAATVNGNGPYTSPNFMATTAGTYRWIASYSSSDTNNKSVSGSCNDTGETSNVNPAAPTLQTAATDATVPGNIQDTATLSGGDNPKGTITWTLYGPGDSNCTKTPVATFTNAATVNGDGPYTSPTFATGSTGAGTYHWIASYSSSDSNNSSVSGSCGDSGEQSTVNPVTPTLQTTATNATVPGNIQDTATLSGGFNPTGTITWKLYGPSDSNCTQTPLATFTNAATVNGNGPYVSPNFAATSVGTYHWIASYSGDTNNNSVSGHCNDTNENSMVTPATPTLKTIATGATAGGLIQDTATLSGGDNPTGTITWKVYGPSDANCQQTPLATFSNAATVNGDGSYVSPNFAATSVGTYHWIASYSGDNNNNSLSGNCNDGGENSVVGPAVPTLTTNAFSATVPGSIHDDATLTGGDNPTGSITWNVYNLASDPSCTGTPLNTSTISVPVNGAGLYHSPSFAISTAGTYQWVATYSGDSNNSSISTGCPDKSEQSIGTNNQVPGLALTKLEQVNSTSPGGFVSGPVTGNVGDTVNYLMTVSNTGTDNLVINPFTDDQCDPNTLSGPVVKAGNYDSSTQTLSPGGELQWTCSHVLTSSDQPPSGYTNTASVTGTPPAADGSPITKQASVTAFANVPGINVVKFERDASTGGSFVRSPSTITVSVGDTIDYKIVVTNTGKTDLTLTPDDPMCDSGTLQGPIPVSGTLNGHTLSAGGVVQYTCSHVATASDIPQVTNTATVTGQPPSGPPVHGGSTVVAKVTRAAIQVVKLQRDASSGGSFTTSPITVTEETGNYVVHTIDYEIEVTNTGNAPLRLSLDDPRCDSRTVSGPDVISGVLNGDTLQPGGVAQYTCSHALVKDDPSPFTNTATVTGTPPVGPPVSGTSHVTVTKKTVGRLIVCRTPSGRVIKYKKGHRKPKACRFHPRKPHKPTGFTG